MLTKKPCTTEGSELVSKTNQLKTEAPHNNIRLSKLNAKGLKSSQLLDEHKNEDE